MMGFKASKLFYGLATEDNDGSTWNANGNYASAASSFQVKPESNDFLAIYRAIISIKDTGINNTATYGALTALTNGVNLYVKDSGDNIVTTLTPFPIKSNGDWASACYDMQILDLGNGDDYVTIRWTFSRSGKPIVLNGSDGTYIEINVNDDLTGLAEHKFFFQGYYLDETF